MKNNNTKLYDQHTDEFIKCSKDPIYWYNTYTTAGNKNLLTKKDFERASIKWYQHLYTHRLYNRK